MSEALSAQQQKLLCSKLVIAVLATTDRQGKVNTAPMHLLWAKNERTILLCSAIRHRSSDNLKTQGRFSLSVMDEEDTAFSVLGSAKLLRQPMEANAHMALFHLAVEEVKSDTAPTLEVIKRVQTRQRNEKVADFFEACFSEMSDI